MEFITQNWMLIFVVICSGAYLLFSTFRKAASSGIAAVDVVQKINREKAIVVDLRNTEAFNAGHIIGARNLPFEQLKKDGVSGLPKNKTFPVILVCASGTTANRAVSYFKQAGYESVYCLEGGVAAWAKAELPLEASSTPTKKDK